MINYVTILMATLSQRLVAQYNRLSHPSSTVRAIERDFPLHACMRIATIKLHVRSMHVTTYSYSREICIFQMTFYLLMYFGIVVQEVLQTESYVRCCQTGRAVLGSSRL